MINVNFIKPSPTAEEMMETDSERVETTQEESNDETYSPDEDSDTQATLIFDGQKNNKKGIDIMSLGLASALDRAKISDRNPTYLLAAVIDILVLPNNYNISRLTIRNNLHGRKSGFKFEKSYRQLYP